MTYVTTNRPPEDILPSATGTQSSFKKKARASSINNRPSRMSKQPTMDLNALLNATADVKDPGEQRSLARYYYHIETFLNQ